MDVRISNSGRIDLPDDRERTCPVYGENSCIIYTGEDIMKETITEDLFDHLVGLAALELTADEAAYLRAELNNQLTAIQELEAIPLSADTTITSHGITYSPQNSMPIRLDEWHAYEHPESIIDQAPMSEDGYIIVPDIPHEELT